MYRALQDALRGDKARTNILKISELGLVEMTRKRTRESLVQTLCEPCPHCEGRGYMLSGESVAYNILREIKNDLQRLAGRRIAITVSTRVAEQLLSVESAPLEELARELGREIEIRARPGLHQEQFEVEALDEGPPSDFSPSWLRDPKEIAAEEEAERLKKAETRKNGNGRRRGRGRGRGARGETPADEGAPSGPEEESAAAASEAAVGDQRAAAVPAAHAAAPASEVTPGNAARQDGDEDGEARAVRTDAPASTPAAPAPTAHPAGPAAAAQPSPEPGGEEPAEPARLQVAEPPVDLTAEGPPPTPAEGPKSD